MYYTKNLNLPVIENTDNFALAFSQPNEIAEKVESKLGGLVDVNDNLVTLQGEINSVQSEVDDLNTNIYLLEESNEEMNKQIESVIDLATFESVLVDGTERKAIKHNVTFTVLEGNYSTTNNHAFNVTDETNTYNIQTLRVLAQVDLTTLLGWKVDELKYKYLVESAKGYFTYDGNIGVQPQDNIPLNIGWIGTHLNSALPFYQRVGMILQGSDIIVNKLTNGYTPGATTVKGDITVVMTYYELV